MRAVSSSRRGFAAFERGERDADAPELAARVRGEHFARAWPFTTSVPREHRRRRARFATGERFAGEQRFVERQPGAWREARVRRHAVAFAEDQQVAAHHFARRRCAWPRRRAPRARAGSTRSRSASSARSAFLSCSTVIATTTHDRGREHQRLVQVAHHEVQPRRRDEQQQHRLAHHLGGDCDRAAALARREAGSAPRRRGAPRPRPRSDLRDSKLDEQAVAETPSVVDDRDDPRH